MFDMDLPWWEFIVRGLAVYLLLLVMVRLSGRRTVGQFTPFDLLVVMLLSEAVSNSLNGGDNSLIGGLIAAATLVAINSAVALVNSRSPSIEKLVEGSAILIGRDGVFFEKVVRNCRLSDSDLEEALREHDCTRQDMKCAFLETDGEITILRKPH
ncbi:DUF421 domain-containing protein [Massilia sp. 9I]|uniref:DUF421 domain-containing protein n=1 Tax=Massilia sp. 9I TaxID=2653152 RepID=UPI0012EF5CF4|nr:YetF domain-containing protein [Massilia sp. 9I]VXC74609.1 Putative membrane protein [Massilia sp. 9I]